MSTRHTGTVGRRFAIVTALTVTACVANEPAARAPAKFLFVWAGPREGESSVAPSAGDRSGETDFIAVVDADPSVDPASDRFW